jgi:hypothetical protein
MPLTLVFGLVMVMGCGGNEIRCLYGDDQFAPGTPRSGCGDCTCGPDGQWYCSDVYCPPDCTDRLGVWHGSGEGWVDEGSWCECDFSGQVFCRPQECNYVGTVLQPGDPVATVCGACTCGADTRLACPQDSCTQHCSETGPSYHQRVPGEMWLAEGDQLCRCTGGTVECCPVGQDCFVDECTTPGGPIAAGARRYADGQLCTCNEALQLTCATTCYYANEFRAVGDPIPPLPGNYCECTCGADGRPACNRSGCLPTSCPWKSSSYSIGMAWVEPETCQVCVCGEDGEVYCGDALCAPGSCVYQGVAYATGNQFPAADGCNQCTCGANGHATCTELACASLVCPWNGDFLVPSATAPANDGCNVCACMYDGSMACTKRPCA